MKIGIGLPSGLPDVNGKLILDWARQADAGPFSTLGVIDRIVYPNYEPMVTMAAAAAVTTRIRFMSVILIATLRNAGVLAKEAASIDALSGGRLTLGLAVGRRRDDFLAAPAEMKGRGKRFEDQLALMRRVWAGEPLSEGIGPVGPPPVQLGGPPIYIGGSAPEALERTGRLADGLIAGGGRGAPGIAEHYGVVQQAWRAAGKAGKPGLSAIKYFGLGPNALERGAPAIRRYYSNPGMDPEAAIRSVAFTPEEVRAVIKEYAAVGMDELIMLPAIPGLDQISRLADLVG
ncbi:MAG: LLM class flavin-dependent oxidoreductase [Chloroflexota bacterium]